MPGKGYVLVDITVKDPVGYEEYKRLATASIARHGGRYLVRGGAHETLEGEWGLHRAVLLEFPSVAAAKAWKASPDYAAAAEVRRRTAAARFVVLEGLE